MLKLSNTSLVNEHPILLSISAGTASALIAAYLWELAFPSCKLSDASKIFFKGFYSAFLGILLETFHVVLAFHLVGNNRPSQSGFSLLALLRYFSHTASCICLEGVQVCGFYYIRKLMQTSPQSNSRTCIIPTQKDTPYPLAVTPHFLPHCPQPETDTPLRSISGDLSVLYISYKQNHTYIGLSDQHRLLGIIMFSKLICVVACVATSFLFIA